MVAGLGVPIFRVFTVYVYGKLNVMSNLLQLLFADGF